MGTGLKCLLSFIAGFLFCGFLTFCLGFCYFTYNAKILSEVKTISEESIFSDDSLKKSPNLTLFDHPQQVIKAKEFTVTKVLKNNNAIAEQTDHENYYGLKVLFIAKDSNDYYTGQKITVSANQQVVQIGKYKYREFEFEDFSTLPVITITDK